VIVGSAEHWDNTGSAEFPDSTGHQDLTTTQPYMHLSPAAIEGAIRLLDRAGSAVGRGDILETESAASDNSHR
jgi:hypothetical protein